MIIRILGEGQYSVDGVHLDELNVLDSQLQTAVEATDLDAFDRALAGLLAAVRRLGTAVPDDSLSASDLVLPSADADLAGVRALLGDEGLIPG
jgi:hypothetical protein